MISRTRREHTRTTGTRRSSAQEGDVSLEGVGGEERAGEEDDVGGSKRVGGWLVVWERDGVFFEQPIAHCFKSEA